MSNDLPRKKRKRTVADRERELEEAVHRLFRGVKSAAHRRRLAESLLAHSMVAMAIIEQKDEHTDCRLVWSDEPAAGLMMTVESYAEFARIPIEDLVGHVINRIPHVGATLDGRN